MRSRYGRRAFRASPIRCVGERIKVTGVPEFREVAWRACGAIKDTALKHDDVASFAGEFFLQHYPDSLKQRYQLETLPATDYELLQLIGKKRGCLRSGGHIDMDKVAKILLS